MPEASVSTVIDSSPADVFAAVSDVTRMGDWSPENTGCRWVAPADGPAVGAEFEGDNAVSVGPITLKRWTTTSEITECTPGEAFEFVTAGYTTWRFDFEAVEGGTRLTESFSHAPNTGVQKFLYDVVARRRKSLVKAMNQTLAAVKTSLES